MASGTSLARTTHRSPTRRHTHALQEAHSAPFCNRSSPGSKKGQAHKGLRQRESSAAPPSAARAAAAGGGPTSGQAVRLRARRCRCVLLLLLLVLWGREGGSGRAPGSLQRRPAPTPQSVSLTRMENSLIMASKGLGGGGCFRKRGGASVRLRGSWIWERSGAMDATAATREVQ